MIEVPKVMYRVLERQLSWLSAPGLERHIMPRMGSGAPVLLEALEPLVALRGYLELIQRGAAPSEHGCFVEQQIGDWLLEAWRAHLEEQLPVRSKPRCLIVGRELDGVVVRLLGVRAREAQGEKVQLRLEGEANRPFEERFRGALKPEEAWQAIQKEAVILRRAWKRLESPEDSRPMRSTSRSNTWRLAPISTEMRPSCLNKRRCWAARCSRGCGRRSMEVSYAWRARSP